MIYGLKHKCPSNNKLERLKFFDIWEDLKQDADLGVLTKPFPNTIIWNSVKHNKFNKAVSSKKIEFRSNEGSADMSYADFKSLVRDLYACAIVLSKINLLIMLQPIH